MHQEKFSLFLMTLCGLTVMQLPTAGKVLATEDCLGSAGHTNSRLESCAPIPAINAYNRNLVDLIIGSTPLEEGDKFATTFIPSSKFTFDVDANGNFCNLKMVSLSGSLARDFWTLYAITSCAPAKPPEDIQTPFNTVITNFRVPQVSSAAAEIWRSEQANSIPRKADAKTIYFPLIPASFIRSFPGTVEIETICAKENLVGIPISSLCPKGQKYWSLESANAAINTDRPISKFLGEWSRLFKSKAHPSKEDILNFAAGMKIKYKSLLKEGEPEAPLP